MTLIISKGFLTNTDNWINEVKNNILENRKELEEYNKLDSKAKSKKTKPKKLNIKASDKEALSKVKNFISFHLRQDLISSDCLSLAKAILKETFEF